MEDFELSSRLGIGNGEVRAKFELWNRKWRVRVRVRVRVRYILTKVTTAT